MKTIVVKLFEYSELSKESQVKALYNYYVKYPPEISDDIYEFIVELLEERGIGICQVNKKNDFKFYCSLSYSQGDGLCFVGSFFFKDNNDVVYTIKHNHRYYYAKSVNISVLNYKNDVECELSFYKGKFINSYLEICEQAEKYGYSLQDKNPDYIEEGYLFYENGTCYGI